MKQECSSFLADHKRDIDWLFSEFGNLNSAELELTSTIVYVDKEFSQDSQNHQALEIADRVTEIKPHFSKPQVQRSIDLLRQKGVLTSIDRSSV
jgi:Fe2+ or Zn2+ uptake regulation protein